MSQKYTLNVDVQSTITGNVCIFQEEPDTNASNIITLAWLSKRAHAGTTLTFEWDIDHSFVWSDQESLGQNSRFKASQTIPADFTRNQTSFSFTDGAYTFGDVSQNPSGENNLYINQSDSAKSNDAFVGIGMSGASTFVVNSQPNMKLIFKLAKSCNKL